MKDIAKFILLSGLLVLVSCKPASEKPETAGNGSLSKQKMLEDYELFEGIFRKANAGLYKYRSENEIDSVFEANKQRLTDNLSYREFYNILWDVIDYTGSSHNSLTYPDSLDKHLSKQKIFFPIPLKYIEGKLYTNLEYGKIAHGSEIVAVNGIQGEAFSSLISRYASTDGFNETGKYANIATDWLAFYIYLAMGEQDYFTVEYIERGSGETRKEKIESVPYAIFYKNYKERHSKDFESWMDEDYSYYFLDSINTGLLNIHTFGMGGPDSEGHKKYASFLDSVFTILKEQKIEKLIVDIRDNGGGNDPNDILLYSYLTKRNFRENKSAFTIFQEIPFREHYADDDIDELPLELKEEHSIFRNGRYYQNESFNKVWEPRENAFHGKLILMVDPFVASAGSLFASMVKSDENTVVIGEETLGGYYGHTGHIPVTYALPNSKLNLTFSIVDLEQDVEELHDEKPGDGIIPDFEVVQTYEDFMNHRDTQLNFAIEKIKGL